jgi:hypothetical protein
MTTQAPRVVAHPSEDVLEEYAFGRLSDEDLAKVEEHLLICQECRDLLQETEHFLLAIRQHAGEEASSRLRTRPLIGYGTALAAAVGALMVAAMIPGIHRAHVETPVQLVAFRGGESGAMIPAAAGATLNLHVDVSDLTPTGVYGVQVVDAQGAPVWRNEARASGGSLRLKMSPGLKPGVYWIRLYSGAELLREFGLRAQ